MYQGVCYNSLYWIDTLFLMADQNPPPPKYNAYISAKTHIDSFLAAQIVTLANICPKKATSCLEYFTKVITSSVKKKAKKKNFYREFVSLCLCFFPHIVHVQ